MTKNVNSSTISFRVRLPKSKHKMIFPFFIYLQEIIFDKFGFDLVQTSVKVRKYKKLQSGQINKFQMMYRNVTYSQRDQMSKDRDQDSTSISFSFNSPLMDDLSQFQIEPPSGGPAFNDANWRAWWGESAAAERTKKDFRK